MPRIAAGHFHDESAHAAFDPGADLEELQPDGADVRVFQFRADEADATDVRDQDLRASCQQHAELVGDEAMATGAVGEQAELLFLEAILHITALAVNVLVKNACVARQVGH